MSMFFELISKRVKDIFQGSSGKSVDLSMMYLLIFIGRA